MSYGRWRRFVPLPASDYIMSRELLALAAALRHEVIGLHELFWQYGVTLWCQRNFDRMRLASPTLQPHRPVNKSHEVLNSVQNSLNFELNGGSPWLRVRLLSPTAD
jgi:hypothetical protein